MLASTRPRTRPASANIKQPLVCSVYRRSRARSPSVAPHRPPQASMQSLSTLRPRAQRPHAPVAAHAHGPSLDAKKAAIAAGVVASAALPALAETAVASDAVLSAGAIAGVAGLGGLLIATDPQKRRNKMATGAGGNEMKSVKDYFESSGFERWNKIYGETDDVNKVQLDIRTGHAQTVDKVLGWLDGDGGVKGTSVCDCGCGTGSLAIPVALRGAAVTASDISANMVGEAERRYKGEVTKGAAPPATSPVWEAKDLESVSGQYDVVACLDVMIHYPQDKADAMIAHLASLSSDRLIISFAPKTLAYSILKRIGELFPGPSKATRAYLHREDDVKAALEKAGFKVTKEEMTATQFYFSRLFEAKRV